MMFFSYRYLSPSFFFKCSIPKYVFFENVTSKKSLFSKKSNTDKHRCTQICILSSV